MNTILDVHFVEDDLFPEFESRDLCIEDIDRELASKEKDWESDWDGEDNTGFSAVLRQQMDGEEIPLMKKG